MMTDPIANMFTIIRNGYKIGRLKVNVPFSKFKICILNILKNEDYIDNFEIKKEDVKSEIIIHLKYINQVPVITHLKCLSKPGLRQYSKYRKIPRPIQGMGLVIVSTPSGVLSGKEAYRKGIGGELICEVY